MELKQLPIAGLLKIVPEPFQDSRGMFARIFCASELNEAGLRDSIVQINHSFNTTVGTIRGMHFQTPPKAETKIIKCIRGAVFDVVIDVRRDSPTFLKWHGELLSEQNMSALLIPAGFAHGFQVLESDSELLYMHTEFFSPGHEMGIHYNDPKVDIQWPIPCTIISSRDDNHTILNDDFIGIET